jgi:hypothetical protein
LNTYVQDLEHFEILASRACESAHWICGSHPLPCSMTRPSCHAI